MILWLDNKSVTRSPSLIVNLPETLTQVTCKSSWHNHKSLKGPQTSLGREKLDLALHHVARVVDHGARCMGNTCRVDTTVTLSLSRAVPLFRLS